MTLHQPTFTGQYTGISCRADGQLSLKSTDDETSDWFLRAFLHGSSVDVSANWFDG
jgi:hypothetical protein